MEILVPTLVFGGLSATLLGMCLMLGGGGACGPSSSTPFFPRWPKWLFYGGIIAMAIGSWLG